MRRGSTPVGAFDVPSFLDNDEEDDYKPRHQVFVDYFLRGVFLVGGI